MVHFEGLSIEEFLTDYWQKKPLVIRKALPGFVNALTPDELAGLSMEEEIESRLVRETPQKTPAWHLKRGPFLEKDFADLPETHWTLLVQGLDRFVPEIAAMLDYFKFIPQWRFDDVMVSYAPMQGSVGPHYDNYDVFLYQAKGRRKWSLTTKNCDETNYLADIDLRIMQQFLVEEEFVLEEGDMLYLPPHVGHYGVSLSEECMTYSFGYRSYQGQELWDSFADFLAEKKTSLLYKDPNWFSTLNSSEIPSQAWLQAKQLMLKILDDESQLQTWFGCFVTQLDQQADTLLPMPLDEDLHERKTFLTELANGASLRRNTLCRFAYQMQDEGKAIVLFINGSVWDVRKVAIELVKLLANSPLLSAKGLSPFIANQNNQDFLFKLWCLEWLALDD